TCFVVANLFYAFGVKKAPISLAIPIMSLTPTFTGLLGAAMLRETPSATRMVGSLLVALGGFILYHTTPRYLKVNHLDEQPRSGMLMMLGAAAFFASGVALDKIALCFIPLPLLGFIQSIGVAAILSSYVRLRGLPDCSKKLRQSWPLFLLSLVTHVT